VADVLVVPTAPRPLELAELPATFDLAAEVDATHPLLAAVLLVQVRTGTRSALEARQLLTDDLGLPVFDAQTRLRESYALAYGTVPADLGDYEDVLTEIRKDGMTA
jgi:chromosome partitioning protein